MIVMISKYMSHLSNIMLISISLSYIIAYDIDYIVYYINYITRTNIGCCMIKNRGISATLLCSCCSLCRYRHIFGYSLVRGLGFHTIAMFNIFQPHLPSTGLFLAIPIMECNDIIFSIGWNSNIILYIIIH
jgi:hypothetical protein